MIAKKKTRKKKSNKGSTLTLRLDGKLKSMLDECSKNLNLNTSSTTIKLMISRYINLENELQTLKNNNGDMESEINDLKYSINRYIAAFDNLKLLS